VPHHLVLLPGPAIPTLNQVAVDDHPRPAGAGEYYITTVYRRPATLWWSLRALIQSDWLLTSGDLNSPESQSNLAQNHAVLRQVVYQTCGLEAPIQIRVLDLTADSPLRGRVFAGDRLLTLNGNALRGVGQIREILQDHPAGQPVTLEVLNRNGEHRQIQVTPVPIQELNHHRSQELNHHRSQELNHNGGQELNHNGGQELNHNGGPGLNQDRGLDLNQDRGLGLKLLGIADPRALPKIHLLSGDYQGNSADLMLALDACERLLNVDLRHSRRVSGSGGLAEEGGLTSVLGLRQKWASARSVKAEIFFVPWNDQAQLRDLKPGPQEPKIVPVRSLGEAIQWLQNSPP